ncbi:MAG: hypothetical protein O7A04_03180 [Acidobacteria bacterium]|nr:hypothetical protein [Acidobacteriota bacterium]
MESVGRSRLLVAVCLALPVAVALAEPSDAAPAPCGPDDEYAALSAWVGEWQIVEGDRLVGQVQLRSILGGCAFEQVSQRTDGTEELGLIYRDPLTGRWEQRWVSSLGHTGSFELAFEPDGVTISGEIHTPEGARTQVRSRVKPRSGGGFLEELELSDDGGVTYDSPVVTIYLPPGEDASTVRAPTVIPAPTTPPALEPAAPTAPADEPQVAQSSPRVTARTKRNLDAPGAIPMQSPMTLEFKLGSLTDLPPGTSWSTTELTPYEVEGVRIPLVMAARRERRGVTSLELTITLLRRAGSAKVDLAAELLSDGEIVAQGQGRKIALGKLIGSYDLKTGRPFTLRLEVDAKTFADLFADGKRPSVRLTVTVR